MLHPNWNVWLWLVALALVVVAELVGIMIFGWLSGNLARFKYQISSESLSLFEYDSYISPSISDPTVRPGFIPKRYQFVIVEYQADQVVGEIFYRTFGDITHVTYSAGRFTGSSTNYLSNKLVGLPALTGLGLLELSIQFGLSFLQPIAVAFFCSYLVVAPIKQVFLDPFNC